MHLPSLPAVKDNTLGRLLVSPDTADDLGWALMEQVDPHSTVDGMSLLQAFCQQRQKRSDYAIQVFKDPERFALPTSPAEPWPDPRMGNDGNWTDRFPSPEMWIMAHLVCNGPDPFAWKTDDGRDVLDFVVKWKNPQLLDQLLRMPSCPAAAELEQRLFDSHRKLPWLHGLAAKDQYGMMAVLIRRGFNPRLCTSSGASALHYAEGDHTLALLLNAGVDPLAQDKKGEYAPSAWAEVALHRNNTAHNATINLTRKLQTWSPAAVRVDHDRANAAIAPVVFRALGCDHGISILNTASTQHAIAPEAWIHPQTGRSVLCVMARDSLRSASSSMMAPLVSVAEKMSHAALLSPGQGGLSDLAWGWLACRNHGDSKDGAPKLAKLMARLEGSEIEKAATLWGEAQKMAAWKIPTNQTKLEEAVQKACTREMHALADDRSAFARNGELRPRLEVLVNAPQWLTTFARWPLDDNGVSNYLGIAREMAISHPHLEEHAMVASANVLLRPGKPSVRTLQSVFNSLAGYLKEGIQWNGDLTGASEALIALQEASRANPSFGDIASQIEASQIHASTNQACAPTPRPRL